jgi:hypothetical protein
VLGHGLAETAGELLVPREALAVAVQDVRLTIAAALAPNERAKP